MLAPGPSVARTTELPTVLVEPIDYTPMSWLASMSEWCTVMFAPAAGSH